MSFSKKLLIALIAGLSLLSFSSVQAALVYVDNSGATPQSYPTLQEGIDAAGDGDSIHVMVGSGPYSGVILTNRDGLKIGADTGTELMGSSGVGFDLNGSDNCKISGFEIYNFDKGVYCHGNADNNEIYNNIFHDNGWGVHTDGNAQTGNFIHHNCFFRQTQSHQCYDNNATANANTWDHNYWDDWTGSPWWYGIEPASPYITADYDPQPIWVMVSAMPATVDVGVDSTFVVTIHYAPPAICNYTPVDLKAIEYDVTFDNTKMSYVGGQNADDLFPNATTNTIISSGTGTINVAQTFLAGGGAPGPGDMTELTFQGDALVTGSPICVSIVNAIDTGDNPITIYTACNAVNIKDVIAPVIDSIVPASGGTYGASGPDFIHVDASDDIGLHKAYYEMSPGYSWMGTAPGAPTYYNFEGDADVLFSGFWGGQPEGTDTIFFKVKDKFGNNYSDPVMWVFTKDVTAPAYDSVKLTDVSASVMAEPGWSNQLDVQLDIYAGGDAVEMYLTGDITSPTTGTWIPFAATSTVMLTSGDGSKTVNVYVRDAYANQVGPKSVSITLDTAVPTLTAFVLDVGATYNTTGIASGDFQGYAGGPGNPYHFWKFKLTGDRSAPTGWNAAVDPVTVTLTAGDGDKGVCARIRDKAGNVSSVQCDSIILDMTKPGAVITLRSKSAATVPPYSTVYTPTNPVDCEIAATGSPVHMWVQNEDASWSTGTWIPFVTPTDAFLKSGQGVRTIDVWLRDAAMNVGGPYTGSIIRDVTPPAAPIGFTAVPAASVDLSWTNDAQVALTRILKSEWNQYPTYPPPAPTYPATPNDSFHVADVDAPGNAYNFDPGDMDIYYFSAFAKDSAGNWSGAANDNATSYILGDMIPEGCVNWDDIVFFSDHFNTTYPNPAYNCTCDFDPTDDGTASGIPEPDGDVDFWDLMIIAQNFEFVRADKVIPFSAPTVPIVVSVDMGKQASVGDVFEAKLVITDANVVKGMHIDLSYDPAILELVDVRRGELTHDQTVFFHSDKADISIAKLGNGQVIGGSGCLAVLKFKLLAGGETEIGYNALDLRDSENKALDFNFNKVGFKTLPSMFTLSQNYPNPFNLNTTISFALPVDSKVSLRIYNITGQLVKTVIDEDMVAGHHTVNWDGTNSSGHTVASGLYLYKLSTNEFTSTKKMVVMK
jgi:parallel beta-helix repeat protein